MGDSFMMPTSHSMATMIFRTHLGFLARACNLHNTGCLQPIPVCQGFEQVGVAEHGGGF